MNLTARFFLACGALSAAVSVMLGAAGAHSLAGLPETALAWFHTALQYHQFHALGLIAVGLVAAHRPASRWIAAAGVLMLAGTLLFSGNLYLRSLAGFHALHAVTPFGGAAFILGWLLLAIGAMRK
jgi:uncharacterized membrane protein YgdD (TMEM256/DUF423 family)